MSKAFWGIVAAIVVALVLVFTFTHKSSNTNNSASQATNHVEGLGQANVKLVEYGDYECPACEKYYPVVKQVVLDENSKIFFQFRNWPITSLHPNAFAGARAAEAAGLMGKFWQMHDLLYDSINWNQWSTASDPTPFFSQYAQELGLNLTQFKSYFNSSQLKTIY